MTGRPRWHGGGSNCNDRWDYVARVHSNAILIIGSLLRQKGCGIANKGRLFRIFIRALRIVIGELFRAWLSISKGSIGVDYVRELRHRVDNVKYDGIFRCACGVTHCTVTITRLPTCQFVFPVRRFRGYFVSRCLPENVRVLTFHGFRLRGQNVILTGFRPARTRPLPIVDHGPFSTRSIYGGVATADSVFRVEREGRRAAVYVTFHVQIGKCTQDVDRPIMVRSAFFVNSMVTLRGRRPRRTRGGENANGLRGRRQAFPTFLTFNMPTRGLHRQGTNGGLPKRRTTCRGRGSCR